MADKEGKWTGKKKQEKLKPILNDCELEAAETQVGLKLAMKCELSPNASVFTGSDRFGNLEFWNGNDRLKSKIITKNHYQKQLKRRFLKRLYFFVHSCQR
ncbi:hypothetical protein [Umezakia ovalisporum]|uniref:Uncharacterized protein n=1 Tax=Umezakia ovalisporum FSS-62 TaxID=2971776 RepID=A0AA43H0D6_9CYAN|nr:hypothetical protein [Umezakia ovalisporum]MDH6064855.1 hypothetical protein [Umezakia ovalisporum FSS-62]